MSKSSILKKAGAGILEGVASTPINRARASVGVGKRILDKASYKVDDLGVSLVGRRLHLPASGAIVAGAAIVSGAKGIGDVAKSRVGTSSNEVYKATPNIPTYENDFGATGDLVFDLYDLRKG